MMPEDASQRENRTVVQSAADAMLARLPIAANPYLAALCNGRMTRETFVRTQRQFFFAVRFFSRPMAALMSRMPDSASRRTLMHNLAEEHGFDDEGDGGIHPAMAHDRTFLAFLATLGVEAASVVREGEGPEVRAFNMALLGACLGEAPTLAFACLGIIEYMFADISAIIGKAVVDRGWIASSELIHYKLHAAIDKRHAAEFFATVNAGDCRAMEDGLALGQHIFDHLYTSLFSLR